MPRVDVDVKPIRYLNGNYTLEIQRCNVATETSIVMTLEVVDGPPFEDGDPSEGHTFDEFVQLVPRPDASDKASDFVERRKSEWFAFAGVEAEAGSFDTDDFIGKKVQAYCNVNEYNGRKKTQVARLIGPA